MNKNDRQRKAPAGAGHAKLPAVSLVVAAITLSALAVVYSSHQSRRLFSELQNLKREGLVLQEEWGRLLLEQSTWASPDRVSRLAEEKLSMKPPREEALRIVRANGNG